MIGIGIDKDVTLTIINDVRELLCLNPDIDDVTPLLRCNTPDPNVERLFYWASDSTDKPNYHTFPVVGISVGRWKEIYIQKCKTNKSNDKDELITVDIIRPATVQSLVYDMPDNLYNQCIKGHPV